MTHQCGLYPPPPIEYKKARGISYIYMNFIQLIKELINIRLIFKNKEKLI